MRKISDIVCRETMGDLTLILFGVSIVLLSWTVAKLNAKLEKQIKKFKKFEEALKKNATSSIKSGTNYKGTAQTNFR
jgi:hypothetical protein